MYIYVYKIDNYGWATCMWVGGACLAGGFPGPVGEGPHPYWKTTKLCFLAKRRFLMTKSINFIKVMRHAKDICDQKSLLEN